MTESNRHDEKDWHVLTCRRENMAILNLFHLAETPCILYFLYNFSIISRPINIFAQPEDWKTLLCRIAYTAGHFLLVKMLRYEVACVFVHYKCVWKSLEFQCSFFITKRKLEIANLSYWFCKTLVAFSHIQIFYSV